MPLKATKSSFKTGTAAPSWRPMLVLVAVFAALFLVLRPWTLDFPLNDDWAYRLPALRLAARHQLRLLDHVAVSLIFQTALGAGWLKLFGLRIGALTASTLFAHGIGSAFFLRLLQEEGVADSIALLGALTLAFNPIALTLACTFMTDGTYLCLVLAALYYYAKGLREDEMAWLWIGSAAAAAAYLTRQLGVVLPAAITVELLRRGRFKGGAAMAVWTLPAVAAGGYWAWLHFIHGPTWASENLVARATLAHLSDYNRFLSDTAFRTTTTVELLGLSAFPLAGGLWRSRRRVFGGRSSLVGLGGQTLAVLFIAAAGILAAQHGSGPYLENTLQRAGLGTLTLSPAEAKAAGIWAWPSFWIAAALISIAGGALLSALLPGAAASLGAGPLLLWAGLGQLAVSCLGSKYFDRYALTLLPSALGLFALSSASWDFRPKAGYVLLLPLAALSLTGAIDYEAWNRAKWEAGRSAVESGLAAREIAGGYDWDAWWNYESQMEKLKREKPLSLIGEWEWQTTLTRRAFISFSPTPPPGFVTAARATYWTPLDFRSHSVSVYRLEVNETPRGDATGGSAARP